ncbi:hypothetical protein L249_1539 [Ophiocordyceps polyrhachis-furcata BCC 54312]|uniref:Calcofluor white hypersensitive protein n=1 Tax=Ophiocordyceps polyrhachis-furcata BCC 54312 TaxID=1330021 RepID=A0A367L4C0_9HYPO|nr:hypothetical protein L249_1539 [Ophiocordyceps polyrhachis-furcata BCC 54312]
MSRSRMPLILGTAAIGGIGYYLYNAGGNAKVAEDKFQNDVHRASANIKSQLPTTSSSDKTEKDLRRYGSDAGAKIDDALAEADKQASKIKSNAEAYARDIRAEANKSIDKFDSKVEEGAAKAKSGVSSWFGGK